MSSIVQTMRSGGTAHPEEIMNFLADRLISGTGGLFNITGGAWLVSEATVPDLSVQVAEGFAYLKKNASDDMVYPVRITGGNYTVDISANSSGSDRIDAIVLWVDLGASANSDISNVAKITAIQGTPAGSPTAPTNSDIETAIGSSNPFIRLADVAVDNGAVSIVDADITDQRTGNEARFAFEVPTPSDDYQVSNKKYTDDEVENNINTAVSLLPDGILYNGNVVTSVSSNDLTVSIKTKSGDDPSPSNPVKVNIQGITRLITSPLSVTMAKGTNWFGSGGSLTASKELPYFVMLIWNSTTSAVNIIVSRRSDAHVYAWFSGTNTLWSYAARGGGGASPASSDRCVHIDRFFATLGGSATYLWSSTLGAIAGKPIDYEYRRGSWAFAKKENQTIASTPYVDMVLDTIEGRDFDLNGGNLRYLGANGQKILIGGFVGFNSWSSGSRILVRFDRSGTPKEVLDNVSTSVDEPTFPLPIQILDANQGDYFGIDIYQGTGSDKVASCHLYAFIL